MRVGLTPPLADFLSTRALRLAFGIGALFACAVGANRAWAAEPIVHLTGAAIEASRGQTQHQVQHQVGAAAAIEAAVGRAQLQEISYGEALLMGLAIIMNDNDNDGEPATFTGGSGSNFAGGSG